MSGRNHKYHVAISFAGAQRRFAEAVALGLRHQGIRVFYDRFEQHILWGRNLHEALARVYNKSCRYCIAILSPEYLTGMWTTFERQHLIDRLSRQHGGDFLLPVRVDGFDGEVPGLPGGVGYLTVGSSRPDTVISVFLRKIGIDTHDADASVKRAIKDLASLGALGTCLRPDRLFTTLQNVKRTYPRRRRLDVQVIHDILGYRFAWRKRPNEPLCLLAGDVSDAQPEYKEICQIEVPEQWMGIGAWVHVIVEHKREKGATGSERSPRNSVASKRKKDEEDDEEPERLLILLYLQSPDSAKPLPELKHEDYASRWPTAAFLGAFFLDEPKAHRFYELAAERFKSIE